MNFGSRTGSPAPKLMNDFSLHLGTHIMAVTNRIYHFLWSAQWYVSIHSAASHTLFL